MQVSNFGKGTCLNTKVDVDTYKSREFDEVPYLDAIATLNEKENELIIFAVNKNQNEKIEFETNIDNIKPEKIIEATQFFGYDVKQTNEDQSMELQNLSVDVTENKISTSLEPLS